jgi:hypothetical protein
VARTAVRPPFRQQPKDTNWPCASFPDLLARGHNLGRSLLRRLLVVRSLRDPGAALDSPQVSRNRPAGKVRRPYFVAGNACGTPVWMHNRLGPRISRGGTPSNARYPTRSSRFVKKPQNDPDVLRKKDTDAMGHREHQAKHPEMGGGREYLESAIHAARGAKFIRLDKTHGSPKLQFYLPDGPGLGGRLTVTDISGKVIVTHSRINQRTARKMGSVPRSQCTGEVKPWRQARRGRSVDANDNPALQ